VNSSGVIYDVGTVFSGPGWRVARDLHCNAVRIRGRDIGRLTSVAEEAMRQGLEVWLSPELFEKSQQETLEYITAAATAAELLNQRWPGRLVFSVGSGDAVHARRCGRQDDQGTRRRLDARGQSRNARQPRRAAAGLPGPGQRVGAASLPRSGHLRRVAT
jgi:hypothetical protein